MTTLIRAVNETSDIPLRRPGNSSETLISVINLALQFLCDVKFIMVNRLNYWYAIVNCTVYSVFIIIIIIIIIII